ncbi:MAG: hypothetical protein GF419_06755, partial [Ignavibacteriales bacterium]|nr:hypothetical protein [Ignavibacteriales bacterium]
GRVSVSIDGVHAVDQSFRAEFKLEAQDDRLYVYTERDEFTPRVFGGKLGALIKVYEEDIPQQKEALLRWGDALVSNVNEIHQTGYSLHDPPKTNVEFFSDFREGKMVMNQFLKDDRNWIAASADGLEGNNEIALAIADLKDEKIVDGLTLSGKYAEIISDLGDAIDLSDDASEGYQLTLDHLKHERDSYSGVSLDEEMTDMITYQRSYEASAKIIKIADELLLTLINMV